MNEPKSEHRAGIAVDSIGGSVIDPTQNVLDLNKAANKRQDDLRDAWKELMDAHIAHMHQISELRAQHAKELSQAESARLDSIRTVDREDVNKTAAQALNAIQTLANVTSTTAEALRNQVATTAQTLATQLSATTTELTKRLTALELSSSEGKGKQSYVDPQMDRLTKIVEDLTKIQQTAGGQKQGQSATWGAIAAGLSITIGLFFVASKVAPPVQPIIYAPAPAPAPATK